MSKLKKKNPCTKKTFREKNPRNTGHNTMSSYCDTWDCAETAVAHYTQCSTCLWGKLVVVLDLDETLVHTNMDCTKNFATTPDYQVEEDCGYFRPHLREFLEHVFAKYDVCIWTAANKEYADTVLRAMLKQEQVGGYASKYIKRVKPLVKLGRKLERLVMVDDKPESFLLNLENGILAPAFKNPDLQSNDDYLLRLAKLLDELSEHPDVRRSAKCVEVEHFSPDKLETSETKHDELCSDLSLQEVLLQSNLETDDSQVQKVLFESLSSDCVDRKSCCASIEDGALILQTLDWLGDRKQRRRLYDSNSLNPCDYYKTLLQHQLTKSCPGESHCNCCLASNPKKTRVLELFEKMTSLRLSQMRHECESASESVWRDTCKEISDLKMQMLLEMRRQ